MRGVAPLRLPEVESRLWSAGKGVRLRGTWGAAAGRTDLKADTTASLQQHFQSPVQGCTNTCHFGRFQLSRNSTSVRDRDRIADHVEIEKLEHHMTGDGFPRGLAEHQRKRNKPMRHSGAERGLARISSTAETAIKPCAIPESPQSPCVVIAGAQRDQTNDSQTLTTTKTNMNTKMKLLLINGISARGGNHPWLP
jgi:hypothetical protein